MKNKFLLETNDGSKIKQEDELCSVPTQLDDGTNIPTNVTGTFSCDVLNSNGGFSFGVQRWETQLGSDTGSVLFRCEAYRIRDRFVVIIDNEIKYDSKFIFGEKTVLLQKNTSLSNAIVLVYTNNVDTAWNFTLGCPQ